MTVLKERVVAALGLAFSIVLFSCTPIDFDLGSEDEAPYIEVESSLDTVPINNSYTVDFDVFDDVDDPNELKKDVHIWVKNEDGEVVSIDTFTETAGVYTVHLQVKDSDGNTSATVTITVVVIKDDITSPVITLFGPDPYILNIDDEYKEPGAMAIDDFDGDISDDIETDGSVNTSSEKEVEITYSVKDKAGNKAEKKRTVRVQENNGNDTEKPEIKLKGDNPMTVYVGDTYKDPGATASDNEDGDITDKIEKFTDVVNMDVEGTYKVGYTVEDKAGNVAHADRTVIVDTDTEPPVITLKGDDPMSLKLNEKYYEPGATAEDNKDGDLTDDIVIDKSDVDVTQNGVCKVVYTVYDEAGNEANKKRTVYVGSVDTIPPKLYLLGDNPLIVTYKGPFIEPGAYALDNEVADTIPLKDLTVVKDIDVNVLADDYKVTYSYSDPAGNEVSKVREIEVADTSAPVISIIGPITINLGVGYPYTEHGATAMDNYDGDMTDQLDTVGSEDVNTSVGGIYLVEYKVTDSNGNRGLAMRTVNVLDLAAPTITLLGDNPMFLEVDDPYNEPGATAYDSTDGDLTSSIVISGTVNSSVEGTYFINYTVADNDGNTATEDRTVYVGEAGVIILTSSDNNSTTFTVNDDTEFQYYTNSSIRFNTYFSQGSGTISFMNGTNYSYEDAYIDLSPSGGKIWCNVRPSSSTRVRFSW